MDETSLLMFLGLTAVTVAAGFFAGRGLARRSLGLQAQLLPGTLKVGGNVRVHVRLRPRSAVQIDAIELRVICREMTVQTDSLLQSVLHGLASSHHHSNRHRSYSTLADERTVFPQNRIFPVGQQQQFELSARLPETGSGTQIGSEHSVRWSLEVRCAIPQAPDAVITLPLQVAPRYT